MSMTIRSGAVLVLAAVVVACGSEPSGDATTTTAREPTTTSEITTSTAAPPSDVLSVGELAMIVLPDDDGALPKDLVVECGGREFPLSALDEIIPLEQADSGEMAAAMEPFMSGPEGENWPRDGWHVLYQTNQEAILVALDEDGHLADTNLTKIDGVWTWSGAGIGQSCEIGYSTPPGLNTVHWELDPSGPALAPDTTMIHVLINELTCADGLEIGDRLIGPQVVMTDSIVRIAFAAQPLPGDFHTCPGIPPQQYVVELPRPMGDREIIEGYGIGISLEDYLD